MAPKKRQSIASEGAAKKRRLTTVSAEVAAGILKSTAIPDSCSAMLADAVKNTLVIFKADRHPYQAQIVKMAEETLSGVMSKLEADVAQAQSTVDSADAERANRTGAESAATDKASKADAAFQSAKEALQAMVAAESAAKAKIKEADKAAADFQAQMAESEDRKTRLTAGMDEAFGPFQASKASGTEGRKLLHAMEKVIKECGCEEPLAEYLVEALKKDPDARGTFDGIAIKACEARKAGWTTFCENAIGVAQKGKEEAAKLKETAEAELTSCSASVPERKAALDTAEAADKDAKKELSSAKASVANYGRDMQAAEKALETAKAALVSFMEGPKKSFDELKDLEPPPEPPAPEPEAPVEAEVVPAPA
jgi:ribosomal protein L18